MKQSKRINLRTLGTISAVSLLALAACKDETTVADGDFMKADDGTVDDHAAGQ